MKINGANYEPAQLTLGDAYVILANQGDLTFSSVEYPEGDVYLTEGSGALDYIPEGKHTLPDGACLPILRADVATWRCPTPQRFEQVKNILLSACNVGQLEEMPRLMHLAKLHLGTPQPNATLYPDTRIMWWQQNAPSNLGYTRGEGWYFGVLPGRDGNGWSNWHYNRIFWMTVALCFEEDHEEREKAWPHYVEQAVAYACFGRFWCGPNKGRSRDEKGTKYIGDSGRIPYEKDWVSNLVGPYMLTNSDLFKEALYDAKLFYENLPSTAWGGAWGSRIPARILENMLQLYMIGHRDLLSNIYDYLVYVGSFLDRSEWLWPNTGNRGSAPESPWMQSELCAVILRIWEQIPELEDVGIVRKEIIKVMERVMSTKPGGGSQDVGGYACLKYRYHTPVSQPMVARFLVNTAFALPALRLLQDDLPTQYVNCMDLIKRYAGSTITDAALGMPYDIHKIGYRFPREGSAWPKTILGWLESIR